MAEIASIEHGVELWALIQMPNTPQLPKVHVLKSANMVK